MSKPNRKTIRLQQMRAQRAEAAGVQYVDVVFENEDGAEETCSFPVQDYWPVEVVETVNADVADANLGILRRIARPADAYDRLVRSAGLTVGELMEILKELGLEAGTTEGEGNGSSTSSETTPGASAPTSSGTTQADA